MTETPDEFLHRIFSWKGNKIPLIGSDLAKRYASALVILIAGMQLARAIDSYSAFRIILAIVLVIFGFVLLWIHQE